MPESVDYSRIGCRNGEVSVSSFQCSGKLHKTNLVTIIFTDEIKK